MPPKMADHRVQARKRMRTSLKMEEHTKNNPVAPIDPEPESKKEQTIDPEAVAKALHELADKFAAKPAERAPDDQQSNVTQLMSRFAPNSGQPQPAGPVDNSGQKDDKNTDEQRVRDAVAKVMSGGKT